MSSARFANLRKPPFGQRRAGRHGGGSYPELREQRASDIHFEPKRDSETAEACPQTCSSSARSKGGGCLHCRQTGYSGRDGIFEILPDAGWLAGMRTLREAAIEKVLNGTTTVSEMVRVTGK